MFFRRKKSPIRDRVSLKFAWVPVYIFGERYEGWIWLENYVEFQGWRTRLVPTRYGGAMQNVWMVYQRERIKNFSLAIQENIKKKVKEIDELGKLEDLKS